MVASWCISDVRAVRSGGRGATRHGAAHVAPVAVAAPRVGRRRRRAASPGPIPAQVSPCTPRLPTTWAPRSLVGRYSESTGDWWPDNRWQRGTEARCPRAALSHVVAYTRQTSALRGTADSLLDAASCGTRWVLCYWPRRPARGSSGPSGLGVPVPDFHFQVGRWLVTARDRPRPWDRGRPGRPEPLKRQQTNKMSDVSKIMIPASDPSLLQVSPAADRDSDGRFISA